MATDKIEFKKLEKVRYYIRDFFINGYKNKDIYKETENIGNSTFANRTKTIGFILNDIADFRIGSNSVYRIMFNQSSVSENPFHQVLKYKSAPESSIQRYFVILSALNKNRVHGVTANDIQYYLDGLDEYYDEKDQHSIIATDLKKLLKKTIIRKSKSCYYINETTGLENILSGNSFKNMLLFYSEVSQFSVIGSFIQDKLACDGGVKHSESVFKYKDRFISQTLDDAVKLDVLEALKNNSFLKIKDDCGVKFICKPLCFFISFKTGREYVFYFNTEDSNFKSIRLDKISEITKFNSTVEFDAEQQINNYYWCPPYIETDSKEHVECRIKIDKNEKDAYERLINEKRNAELENDGETVKLTVDTNDIKNTLFFLKSFTGRIIELDCSNKNEQQSFIRDIDEALALYGE